MYVLGVFKEQPGESVAEGPGVTSVVCGLIGHLRRCLLL